MELTPVETEEDTPGPELSPHGRRGLFAARPDLREAAACKLYEKGVFSLGKAAEWPRVSIEDLKEALHRMGINREAPESASETEAMALATIKAAGRSAS